MLFVNLSCSTKNNYFFSDKGLHVIINKSGISSRSIESDKEGNLNFYFPENKIILSNISSFKTNITDNFYYKNKLFNPDDTISQNIKLCYFRSALNCGRNDDEYDFYYFRIGVTCEEDKIDEDKYFKKLLIYIDQKKKN